MSWAEQRARRLLVPWDQDTPDARGFWEYAKSHYHGCFAKAWEIAKEHAYGAQDLQTAVNAVFEKLASPLVYLYEAWVVLAPEKKARYNPQIGGIQEQVAGEVRAAFEAKSAPAAAPAEAAAAHLSTCFAEELQPLLSFEEKDDHFIIKPRRFLGVEKFSEIAEVVESLGGRYVSAGRESHFVVPKKGVAP